MWVSSQSDSSSNWQLFISLETNDRYQLLVVHLFWAEITYCCPELTIRTRNEAVLHELTGFLKVRKILFEAVCVYGCYSRGGRRRRISSGYQSQNRKLGCKKYRLHSDSRTLSKSGTLTSVHSSKVEGSHHNNSTHNNRLSIIFNLWMIVDRASVLLNVFHFPFTEAYPAVWACDEWHPLIYLSECSDWGV